MILESSAGSAEEKALLLEVIGGNKKRGKKTNGLKSRQIRLKLMPLSQQNCFFLAAHFQANSQSEANKNQNLN